MADTEPQPKRHCEAAAPPADDDELDGCIEIVATVTVPKCELADAECAAIRAAVAALAYAEDGGEARLADPVLIKAVPEGIDPLDAAARLLGALRDVQPPLAPQGFRVKWTVKVVFGERTHALHLCVKELANMRLERMKELGVDEIFRQAQSLGFDERWQAPMRALGVDEISRQVQARVARSHEERMRGSSSGVTSNTPSA